MTFAPENENLHTAAAATYDFSDLHEPAISSAGGEAQIFRKLDIALSSSEILQLCRTIKMSPVEVVLQLVEQYRRACKKGIFVQVSSRLMSTASSLQPEQLSLVTDYHSLPTVREWTEDTMPHAPPDIYHQSQVEPRYNETASNSHSLSKADSPAASATWHVCIACDQSYALSAGLGKHQRTVCERTRYWKCPLCDHLVFEKLSELHDHHLSVHRDTCAECHSAVGADLSDHCKALLSTHTVEIGKRAWGCPCCIHCFDTLRAWNRHKMSHWHQLQNERLTNWSFTTMVRSLLSHRYLLPVSKNYNWSLCSWAHMGKSECQTLRFALERHVIPSTMLHHELYSQFHMPDSLVLHTYTLGTAGHPSASYLPATIYQTASNFAPTYSHASINQVPTFGPVHPTFNQQDYIEGDHIFQPGTSQSLAVNTFALDPDEEEGLDPLAPSDVGLLEYKRATGAVQKRLVDDEWYHRSPQGPAPLASYVPCPQDRHRVRLKALYHRKRAKDGSPFRRKRPV